tara:strand:- start:481 stop:663 length:183 start_codon:yes stop_codon:yes gene_type:complete
MSGDHMVAHNGTFEAQDQRIKKELVDIDDASALESLRLLKPKSINTDMIFLGVKIPFGVS